MGLADIFNQDAFSMFAMTAAIQKAPFQPGALKNLIDWEQHPVNMSQVIVEEFDGSLALLPTAARGAQSSMGTPEKRTVRSFVVPHIPHDDAVMADDVLNLRTFGSENALEPIQTAVNRKLARMRRNHETTHENLRAGALQGLIQDADGSTIYDLSVEFDQVALTNTWVPASHGVAEVIAQKRKVEDAVGVGIDSLAMTCICSDGWYDSFTGGTVVKTAFDRWREGEFLRVDNRRGFVFGGVEFLNYRGAVGATPFLSANTAILFPKSVPGMWIEVIAPANFMETVGTAGQLIYAKQNIMKNDIGVELHTQSNYLPLCTRTNATVLWSV